MLLRTRIEILDTPIITELFEGLTANDILASIAMENPDDPEGVVIVEAGEGVSVTEIDLPASDIQFFIQHSQQEMQGVNIGLKHAFDAYCAETDAPTEDSVYGAPQFTLDAEEVDGQTHVVIKLGFGRLSVN